MITQTSNPLFSKTHWGKLGVYTGIAWVMTLLGYQLVERVLSGATSEAVVLLVVGLFFVVAGAVLTLRSHYELVPERRYVLGAVLLGLIYALVILVVLNLLASSAAGVFFVAFMLVLGAVPATLLRKYGVSKRLDSVQLAGILIVLLGVWFLYGTPLHPSEVSAIHRTGLLIPLLLVVYSLVHHKFNLDVLSPWVLQTWKGVALFALGIGMVLYGLTQQTISLDALASLPVYQVLLLGVVGFLEMLVVLFRHKTRMAQGYIAYKQIIIYAVFLLVSVAISTLFEVEVTVLQMLAIFTALTGLLLIEKRMFGWFGAIS